MAENWAEFRQAFSKGQAEGQGHAWPQPVRYAEFKTQLIEKPRPIVENLLDVSSRMIFGGGSKTYKTWVMTEMALSVVVGADWWGFSTYAMPALYVNFELKDYYMQRRMRAIQSAKKLSDGPLYVWNLRGYEITLSAFVSELLELVKSLGVMLVFIDPFYKLLAGRDERVSAEINQILAAFDDVNRLTGATVVFSAHFTKGNQAGKDSMDRISGGGSINRDPDDLVTMTKHEEEHAFTVEFTVRDFAPIEPFVVRWEHPLLVRTDLDPTKLRKPAGRPSFDAQDLYRLIQINDDELSSGELAQAAAEEFGWSRRTVFNKLKALGKRVFLS